MIKRQQLRHFPLIGKILSQVEVSTLLQYDALALHHLRSEMPDFYLPWTGSAVAPSSLRIMLNEIVIYRKKSLVEFGAGISSIFFAKVLKRLGGKLVSIEQDAAWLAFVRDLLDREGLGDCVDFVHCPIDPESKPHWYHKEKLNKALEGLKFDFAFIDAPISSQGEDRVREPAALFLQDFLSAGFTVFLDDMNREGEQRIAEAWQRKYSWYREDFWPRGTVSAFRAEKAALNIC
jgi:hypothetical protein